MANENKTVSWPGWETVRLIGRGSFGTVYEIERDVFGHKEKAALKVISIPQSDSDIEELYDSGYDEASVTAAFQSHLESIVKEYSLMREMNGAANVVNCDDFRVVPHEDSIGWDIQIRMELLTPLTKALDKQPGDEQVIRVAEDMCRALVLCKKHGIIHRDIKPQNIFISKNGDYKLGDFGIAKTIEKTTGGTKIGTYKYMAPEIYNNQPYNQTADIYSLGLVLHWLLNERRAPFMPLPPEPAGATQENKARERRFAGEPVPAPAHGSEELKRIVLKACAYDPKDRYQSAEEMLRDLEALDGKTSAQHSDAFVPESVDQEPEAGDTVGAFNAPAPARPVQRSAKSEEKKEDGGTGDVTVGAFDRGNVPPPPQPKPKPKLWPILVGLALLALLAVGFFTVHIWTPATCDTAEKCRICGKPRGEALGHDWGEWSVVTEPSCTEAGLEQRICRTDETHIETREIPATGHTWKDATCTEPSVCTVCGAESSGPIGHDWGEPTYTWSTDNSMVAAKRVCKHNAGHVEEEAVSTSSEITTPASCTEMGRTTYTANFGNSAFPTQTKTVENIAATDHSWSGVSYSWSSDNGSCTATRTCSACGNTETETVESTSAVTTAATCTEMGKTTYTATFGSSTFSTQTKTVENIPATDHSWSSVSYSWSSDNGSCTATRTCSVCGETESETAKTTSKVTAAPTYKAKGKTTYTAIFGNSVFSTQTKTVEVDNAQLFIANKYSVGDYVFFGAFEQDGNAANGPEPIEWLVLEVMDSEVLLISNKVLCELPYSYDNLEHTWDVSVVRQWLNTVFLNTAFSEDERAQITASEVENSPYRSTWDKVICLSQEELERLFPTDDARIALSANTNAAAVYWTSTEEGQASQWVVHIDGSAQWSKSPVFSTGVRPAIRLSRNGNVKEADRIGYKVIATGYYERLNWDNITEISMGSWHVLGLKNDGTVVAQARNSDYAGKACEISDWTDIVSLAAGNGFSVGLKSDGTAVSTGIYSDEYEIDVSSWNNLRAICAEEGHAVGLRWDGTVVATGWNGHGQCDVSTWSGIHKIAAGDDFTVGLTTDGYVVCTEKRFDVSNWTNICEIGAGGNFVIGREYGGTVHLAYYDEWGKFDISNWGPARRIAAGYYGALALSSTGKVFGGGISTTLGTTLDGHEYIAVSSEKNLAFSTEGWTNIVQIATDGFTSVGLSSDGTVVAADEEGSPADLGAHFSSWNNIRRIYVGSGGVIGLQYYS